MSDRRVPPEPAVDLAFPVMAAGGAAILAVDHAYPLFAALCRIVPELHGDRRIGIQPIPGRLIGQRRLRIDRRARLTLRVPPDRIDTFLPIAGQSPDSGHAHFSPGSAGVRSAPVSAGLDAPPERSLGCRHTGKAVGAVLQLAPVLGVSDSLSTRSDFSARPAPARHPPRPLL